MPERLQEDETRKDKTELKPTRKQITNIERKWTQKNTRTEIKENGSEKENGGWGWGRL